MSENEVRKKIDELLIVDDVSMARLKTVLQIGYVRAAKIMEFLEDEGYLIEMGCYQKKFNFDFYDELKDVIFEQFSQLVKVA